MLSSLHHARNCAIVFLLACAALLVSGCLEDTLPDTIVLGEQVTAPDPALPSTTDNTATIDNVTVTSGLTLGQPSTITLSCTVSDPGGTIQTVAADFSAIGGPKGVMLKAKGNLWIWSGIVTASIAGSGVIMFTASDDKSTVATQPTNVVVSTDTPSALAPANQPPAVVSLAATGNLIQGQICSVAISCTASDPDGTVRSVTADLSQIGGPALQALTNSGSQWTWSGTVIPPVTGSRTILFTATDDKSAVGISTVSVLVPAASPSTVTNMAITGPVIEGQDCSIIVCCTTRSQAGTMQSISADLASLGGSRSQALAYDGYYWTWSGTVRPPTGGIQTVTFAATDQMGDTTTASAIAGVANPRVTVRVPGVTKPGVGSTWIEANRIVQGQACNITVACGASAVGINAQSVVADLSQIGGPAWQPLTHDGNQWMWSGTVNPPASGIKRIALTGIDDQSRTTAVWTVVGVMDAQVLYGDWLFVLGSPVSSDQFQDYADRLVGGVEATHIPVVLLECGLWDWNDSPRAYSSLSRAQVTYLVKKLRELPGVTVGFHSCPTGNYNTGNKAADLAALKTWLLGEGTPQHPGALGKLTRLGAKIAYADGSPWNNIFFYEQSLREVVGPDGILLEGDIGRDGLLSEGNAHFRYIDGSTTRDQGELSNTYYFAHPRQYVDWRIATVSEYRTFVPAWTRREIGWIGECVEWWIRPQPPAVTAWPISDYAYAWGRARESGIPLQYRATMESLGRLSGSLPDPRLQKIGQMEQNRPTTTGVNRTWSSLAMSEDGTRLVAAAYAGRLYVSTDSGATWAERQPAGNVDKAWSCVAMSSSGTKIVAAAWNGRLYVSADSGATWTERRPGAMDMYWQRVTMSADGTRIVARPSDSRHSIHASADSGNTWTEIQLPGAGLLRDHESWSSVAISRDGGTLLVTDSYKLHAATRFGGPRETWTTCDFGANWPSWDDATAIIAGYPKNTSKSCIALSSDGTKMISGSWPDRLYVSRNSGVTWAEPLSQPQSDKVRQYWQCVAMSSDGTRVLVGAWPGRLYTGAYDSQSQNWTWTEVRPVGDVDKHWECVAMSPDGTKIVTTDGAQLYTSADSGATWVTPTAGLQ